MRKIGTDLREEALSIEDKEGTKMILHFEELPELEPASQPSRRSQNLTN